MPGLHDELLLGADFEHVAHCRKNLSVSVEHLNAFRRVLEMLDVVVGIEGGEPHHAAEPTLHTPHPVNRIRIYSACRRIKDDSAEYFEASNVLAREPSPVSGWQDVIFENERLQPAILIERRDLLIVRRPPEN